MPKAAIRSITLSRQIVKNCGGSRAELRQPFGPKSRLNPVSSVVQPPPMVAGEPARMNLEDIQKLPGMLSNSEVECLFHLGQFNECQGVIVEIGSWKGKSTVTLALGAAKAHDENIYAIDPHLV